mmetsp:Transcript_13661/g.33425  ORF Transcript_13661/g.33425 Transcript_13661/m.33425 type:complete len:1914 (-) Transcript_13661:162-5903(-)
MPGGPSADTSAVRLTNGGGKGEEEEGGDRAAADYKQRAEELQQKHKAQADGFADFKRESEEQTELLERELKETERDVLDLQNSVQDKEGELRNIQENGHSSARSKLEKEQKVRDFEARIAGLTEAIRRLENECTSCRNSARIESARKENMSTSLTKAQPPRPFLKRNSWVHSPAIVKEGAASSISSSSPQGRGWVHSLSAIRVGDEARSNLETAKKLSEEELTKYRSRLEEAKALLKSAEGGGVEAEKIEEEIERIKALIGFGSGKDKEAEEEKQQERANGSDEIEEAKDKDTEPPITETAEEKGASNGSSVTKTIKTSSGEDLTFSEAEASMKLKFIQHNLQIEAVLSKRASNGSPVTSEEEAKELFSAAGIELDTSQISVLMTNHFDVKKKELGLTGLLLCSRKLDSAASITTLSTLSRSSRLFFVGRALEASLRDGQLLPNTEKEARGLLGPGTGGAGGADEREEVLDLLESSGPQMVIRDLGLACRAVLKSPICVPHDETVASSSPLGVLSPTTREKSRQMAIFAGAGGEEEGKGDGGKGGDAFESLLESAFGEGNSQRRGVMDALEEFDAYSFRNAYKSQNAVEDEGKEGASDQGWKARDAVMRRRGLQSRIFDQSKRHALNLARIVSLKEDEDMEDDGKAVDLDAFLNDQAENENKFCYERNHLAYVVPMAIKAMLLYHSFSPKDDDHFEDCLAKALAVFGVSSEQLEPLWNEVEPLSFQERKGKEAFIAELQRHNVEGELKHSNDRLIHYLKEQLQEIQLELEEKKKKEIVDIVIEEEQEEDAGGGLFFCCGKSDAERKAERAAKLKKRKEEAIKKRNQELLEAERKEDAERRQRMERARKMVFGKTGNNKNHNGDEDGQENAPLARIPPLTEREIILCYNTLYATLLEVDNATATGRWREFDATFDAKNARKLNENITSLDDTSKSILTRFSFVFGVDLITRYLYAIEATFFHLNLRNVSTILDEIREGVEILCGVFVASGEDGSNEKKRPSLVRVPEELISRSKSLGNAVRMRPAGGACWTEERQQEFVKYVCRTFQWCYWCISKYHIAFARERKAALESKARHKGFENCLHLLRMTHRFLNENAGLASGVLVADQKYIEELRSDGNLGFKAAAGYGPKERPFFVLDAQMPDNSGAKTWSELVSLDLKVLCTAALRSAANNCFNDFVTLTEPPRSIYGDISVSVGKFSQLASGATRLSPRDKVTYSIEAGGKSKPGGSVRAGDGDFKGNALTFKSTSMMTPLVVEVYEDNFFNDRLIGTITLDLYAMYRRKEIDESVSLNDVKLQEEKEESNSPNTRRSPTGSLAVSKREQKKITLDVNNSYNLGYPLDSTKVKATLEVGIKFTETDSPNKAEAGQADGGMDGFISSEALGIKDVFDAPQLANVLIAIMQELESDITASALVRRELDIDLLAVTMEQYFTSCRIGLQFLLRREEYGEENKTRRHISNQILELYRLTNDLQKLLVKNGFDLANGAGSIEPLFEPYVEAWIKDKEDLVRYTSIPKIVREVQWTKKVEAKKTLGSSEGDDEGSGSDDDDEMRHSNIVVPLFTIFHNLDTYFKRKLPYTERNRRSLVKMYLNVVRESFVGEIAGLIQQRLEGIDNKHLLWGTGAIKESKGAEGIFGEDVLTMYNTIDVAITETAVFFIEMQKKDEGKRVDAGERPDEKMTIEAFKHYGLLDQWKGMYQDKVNIICDLARRIGIVLTSRTKSALKEKDDRPLLHHKMKESFAEWRNFLDAFFLPWAKYLYYDTYKQFAILTMEALIGNRGGLEELMIHALNEGPPWHYTDEIGFLMQKAKGTVYYFGKNQLGFSLEDMKSVADGPYHRLVSIQDIAFRPSKVLMKEGGIVAKEGEESEEIRLKTKPYVFRSTVLNVLKYRYYKANNNPDDKIPYSFITKNDLKKGLFKW